MSADNPFFVLGLSHDATPGDIERQSRKLIGQLELGSASAKTYETPFGARTRDATMVREAVAALRDPKRRAVAATVAELVSDEVASDDELAKLDRRPDSPLRDAFRAGGYEGL